ncbi:hypothetical protein ScPMuIL_006628 [Solemya velum]
MAASDPIFSVKLTPDDVPGAKFWSPNVSEHSVCELKRWLACRGLPVGGLKDDLIKRCISCIEAGKSGEILLSIDGGTWFQKKALQVIDKMKETSSSSLSTAPFLAVTGWKIFPSGPIPKAFTYGVIYEHIIATARLMSTDGGDDDEFSAAFNTSKPMSKGRQFFLSGHVNDIQDIRKNDFYFLKAKVMPSYSQTSPYNLREKTNMSAPLDVSSMDREELLILAKLSEQSERYEDMVSAVKRLVEYGQKLTDDERNMMSVAYKNVVGQRRSAWRTISAIQEKETELQAPSKIYIKEITSELEQLCSEVLDILDGLIKVAEDDHLVESGVFYYKMRGDYYRYLAEINTDEPREAIIEKALDAYSKSDEMAKELPKTHLITLGLALNFSVFYYEIMNQPKKACELAKKAFENAIGELDSLKHESYRDSTLILQLLRDNLTLWSSESE